ncbi:ATP-binding cassette domain-containing protein [Planomicrobium sp. YIM 101495]|uniref:ATP-binding cassette domain-containing protein n=1 Tax=Planomicrobium sp. YIM 101495 TaxID=2665160 RepID=UPI0013FA5503|nr:ATP-binding cassette domain-containing protein [Planomicrobium sp. YIM 101495]
MIEIKHAKKRYGNVRALDGLNLTLDNGKIIGIAGENGSGKSTLLKCIAGVSRIDAGQILIDGQAANRRRADDIAYLPDADLFYPYFTAAELFTFYESQFADFQMAKAREALAFLQVDPSIKLKRLSKGNRGRVKMAATLGREARYYLMDEPFSGMDPLVRTDLVKGLIRFIDLERQTLILSTHELREVETLLDELVVLHGGTSLAHRTLEEVREESGMDSVDWMTSLMKMEKLR